MAGPLTIDVVRFRRQLFERNMREHSEECENFLDEHGDCWVAVINAKDCAYSPDKVRHIVSNSEDTLRKQILQEAREQSVGPAAILHLVKRDGALIVAPTQDGPEEEYERAQEKLSACLQQSAKTGNHAIDVETLERWPAWRAVRLLEETFPWLAVPTNAAKDVKKTYPNLLHNHWLSRDDFTGLGQLKLASAQRVVKDALRELLSYDRPVHDFAKVPVIVNTLLQIRLSRSVEEGSEAFAKTLSDLGRLSSPLADLVRFSAFYVYL